MPIFDQEFLSQTKSAIEERRRQEQARIDRAKQEIQTEQAIKRATCDYIVEALSEFFSVAIKTGAKTREVKIRVNDSFWGPRDKIVTVGWVIGPVTMSCRDGKLYDHAKRINKYEAAELIYADIARRRKCFNYDGDYPLTKNPYIIEKGKEREFVQNYFAKLL